MKRLSFIALCLLAVSCLGNQGPEKYPEEVELTVSLNQPSGLRVVEACDSHLKLEWESVERAEYYIWTLRDLKEDVVASGRTSNLYCNPEGLVKGWRYFLQVKALNSTECSEYSSSLEAVPGGVPDLLFVAEFGYDEDVKWKKGDLVLVSDGVESAVYEPTQTSCHKTILSPLAGEPQLEASRSMMAYYPASYGQNGVASLQTASAGVLVAEPCEASAQAGGYSLDFHPVCGYVSVTVSQSEDALTSMKLTALGNETISDAGNTIRLVPEGSEVFQPGDYKIYLKPAVFSQGLKLTLSHKSDTKSAFVSNESSVSVEKGKDAVPFPVISPDELTWAGLSMVLESDGDKVTAVCDNPDAVIYYEYSYVSMADAQDPSRSSARFPSDGINLRKKTYVKVLCLCEDFEDVTAQLEAVPMVKYGTEWNVQADFEATSGFFYEMYKAFGTDEILSGELSDYKMTFAAESARETRASKSLATGAYFHFDKAYLKFTPATTGVGRVSIYGCGSSKTSVRTLTFYINGDKTTAKVINLPLSTDLGTVYVDLDVKAGDEISFTSNNPSYLYSIKWEKQQ